MIMKYPASAFVLLTLLNHSALAADAEWKNILPTKEVHGEIVVASADAEVEAIAAKMQAAVKKDPSFFQSQVKKAGPGQPIAYDKKLGVSEAEFKKLIEAGASGGFILKKVTDAQLSVSPGGFAIAGPNANYSFRTKVSPANVIAGEFSKPYGAPQKFDNPKAPGGGMKGFSFKVENAVSSDPKTMEGYTSNLVIGRFYDKKNCFLSVTSKEAAKGTTILNKDFIFRYPCP